MTTATQLKQAGFSDAEVAEHLQEKGQELLDAGFSQQEISEHFGSETSAQPVQQTPFPEMITPEQPFDPSEAPGAREPAPAQFGAPFASRMLMAMGRATGIPMDFFAGQLPGGVEAVKKIRKLPWYKKFPEATGWTAATVAELTLMHTALTKAGFLMKLPKSATVLDKAAETAKWFGAMSASREARKIPFGGQAEALPVLRDAAIGAVFSFAVSGVSGIWNKLRPDEQMRALKILGLKRGATPGQIKRASWKLAHKTHPDKVKGMRAEFEKVMKAREVALKGPPKDIVYRGKAPAGAKLLPGAQAPAAPPVRPAVAPVTARPAKAPITPPKAAEAGKALEVFHGGSPEIVGKPLVEFADKGDIRGVFFTEDKDVAEQFAKEQVGEHGKVSRYQVTLENPAANEIVDAKIKEGRELGYKEPHLGDWVTDELLAEGYDGAIRETGYGNEIIAFTNEAIAPPKAPEAKVAELKSRLASLRQKAETVRPSKAAAVQSEIRKIESQIEQAKTQQPTEGTTNVGGVSFTNKELNKPSFGFLLKEGDKTFIPIRQEGNQFFALNEQGKTVIVNKKDPARPLQGGVSVVRDHSQNDKTIQEVVSVAPTEGKVEKMTTAALEKETAVFDRKIEVEKQRLDKLVPERQVIGGADIQHLSQEDLVRFTTVNDELARREAISKTEAQERVKIKRQLRERGIAFDAEDTTENLRALAHPPTAKEPEIGEEEMAVTETGISERDRRARVKAVEEQIRQHELYQDAVDVESERTMAIGTGFYYIPPSHKSEVYDIIGYPKKGRETALQKMFTFELGTGAQSYDQTVQEALARYTPEGDDTSLSMDVTEFVQRVKDAYEAKRGRKTFNERALTAALETGEPTLQLLNDIRYGLQGGKTIEEINANTIEFAEFYGLTKEDVSDYIIPEYTDEQRAKEIKAARPKDEKVAAVAGERQAREAEERRQRSAKMKRIQEEEKLRKMAEQASLQKQGELEKRARQIASEKGLIGPRGKPTQNYTRFAKAMTGKPRVEKMTVEEAEHFIDMLEALTVGYKGRAKIPTSKHLITKELADKIGKFRDIGFAERFRPAWRVFEKIGIRKEIFDPTLESEIKSTEELFAFREKAKELQKLVGSDKEISRRLFLAMENPGKIKLNENEQKVIKWAQRFFQDWARRLHLSGEKRRKNYITHIFEREITEDLKKKYPLDPDLVKALEFITPKTVFNPYLQKRLGKKIGLKEDFWAALQAYEGRALKTFYYEPLIKRLRVYQKFLPPNAARYLRNYIGRITNRPTIVDREVNHDLKEAGKEIEKLPGGKNLAKYLQRGNAAGMLAYNMTGIYYECWLGLRPASAIKNLSQHGLILAETGPVAFTKALKTTGKERAGLLERSLALRSRKLGYLPGIDQTFIKSLESKRRKITMVMFRAADRKNVSDAFLAGYYEAKAKGLPDEWAYKRGDEVARKTQWLYNKMAGSQFTQTAPGRVLGVLTTWPENWAELMNDWIQAKPSSVYTDYTKLTGQKVEPTNWIARRKSLWTYLALVSLAMLIHKKTPFKALYYTGWTSLRSLADMARGKLAGLNIPGIIADLTAGILTADKKRIKRAWNEIKRFPVIVRELTDIIITGKKDWINLFVYIEKEKEPERAGGRSGGRAGGR